MKNTQEILKGLSNLITTDTPKDVIDQITHLSTLVDENESEHASLIDEHNLLKQDYINVVKHYGFKESNPNNQIVEQPKTLEQCLDDIIAQRGKTN